MFYQFPEGFYWGGASSALQTEGSDTSLGKTIFDVFYAQAPNRFFDGVGPNKLADFYHRYKEDIGLYKAVGHNSHRTSISWARLIPDGDGAVDQEAVAYYHEVIDEFQRQGITLIMNLMHFDMPAVLQAKGGFENREVVDAYVRYAKICFELFGDKVKLWATFNEPIVTPEGGYLYDFHYPNVVDFKRAVQVSYNMIIAHAAAVKIFHQIVDGGEICTILNITPIYPRSENPKDVAAARIADLIFVRSFLDPVLLGEWNAELVAFLTEHDLLPKGSPGDDELIDANRVDFIGLNYYQPRRVKAKEHLPHPESVLLPESFFDYYEMQGRRMNTSRGWEIYPKAIYDMLMTIKNEYGNVKCYIAENGMGIQQEQQFRSTDGVIDDSYRIDFYKEHLRYVHQAISEGVNCFGYHIWTPIDNWSMINAYKNRYGVVELDVATGERKLKKSGYWFKELADANGFDD